MYRNIKKYEIRYVDADAYDKIKLSALLGFLQESACLSADELGFGYDAIAPKNIGFVIVNWYVELLKPVKLGDELEIHTWPLKPRHMIFLRDYELYVNGEKVGVAIARWCMIDTQKFSFLTADAFFEKDCFDNWNTERVADFNSWKIPPADGEKVYSRKVRYSDYDHYFHMNNTKYADILLDVFSVEDFKDKYVQTAQLTYSKQCKIGEGITVFKKFEDGYYYIEGKVDGETRVQLKVRLNDIQV